MNQITLKAYAKLNLTLDIIDRRADGYHNLRMLMQSVDLFDTVTITRGGEGIRVILSDAEIPSDERNTAYRAAMAFYRLAEIEPEGLTIEIEKRIPSQAGMAGGSADAAAVLEGMNTLYKTQISNHQLIELGAEIGADVPFCIVGGTKLVEGIGDLITDLPEIDPCYFVIAKGETGVNTGAAFRRFDECGSSSRPDTDSVLAALVAGDLEAAGQGFANALYDAADLPEIGELIEKIKEFDPLGAVMTGSGSAVFGMFTDLHDARRCEKALRKEVPFVCLAKPVSCGLEEVESF
ncbi:MAG: 4-(cytidine 5'-diphospho)-2-C-methyl-D-erythritol kinase [Ruminococcaceae bacterium]|nr:4-(cytidine 5'-diphospho)-2-C-methyl-D-erythritol kinase [Oscillospiraceae bacterium]